MHRKPTRVDRAKDFVVRLPHSFMTVASFWLTVVAVGGFLTGWGWAQAVNR